ncbi:hypothetical protein [Fluviicola sp.]|uniref:hypothetical protein n=1 Tax=Fluviicola sp. TaxID=1917219 RepID=UPI0031D93E3E
MEQAEFLEQKVFNDLKNLNDGFDKSGNLHFNEWDFAIVLDRCEYFGISIYEIQAWLDGALHDTAIHEKFRKKATDSSWYKKALMTFSTRQKGLTFTASYKVSPKLLARQDKTT